MPIFVSSGQVMVKWLARMTPTQEVLGLSPGIYIFTFFGSFLQTAAVAEVQTTIFGLTMI